MVSRLVRLIAARHTPTSAADFDGSTRASSQSTDKGCAVWQALLLALCLACTASAWSHAVLVDTEPVDGAALQEPPTEIILRFNEPVAPVVMRVVGPGGHDVILPESIRAVDREVRFGLLTNVGAGGYLVSYRVVSADSHPIGGSFVFAIGATTAMPAKPIEGARYEDDWAITKVVLRFVQNFALLLAAGGALFQVLVLPANRTLPILNHTIIINAFVAILTACAGLGVQGGLIADAPASALALASTWRLGLESSVGTSTMVLVPALVWVVVATRFSARLSARIAAAVGAVAAVSSLALTGHGATTDWLARMVLMTHVISVAYWLGALWPLIVVLRSWSSHDALRLVQRFSVIAVGAITILLLSAVVTGFIRIDEPRALIQSDYGRILLAKALLVVAMLWIAVINRQRVTPALVDDPLAGSKLSRNIRFEFALAGIVVLASTILAHTPPAQSLPEHTHHEHHTHHSVSDVMVVSSNGRFVMRLAIHSSKPGPNRLDIQLLDSSDEPISPIELEVALSLPAAGIEPLVRAAVRTNDESYRLESINLPIAGLWQVRVDALISDFEKAVFTTDISIR